MKSMHQEIEAHLLSVFAIVHPEGFAIKKLATFNVATRRIFNLYPLEAGELPSQMANLLTSPKAALKFFEQMLDDEYAEVLDELCEAVPSEKRGPLLVPVISAAKDTRHIDAILERSLDHFGERWEAKPEEVVRAPITSAGEVMWLAFNHASIEELNAGSKNLLWLVSTLETCLRATAQE